MKKVLICCTSGVTTGLLMQKVKLQIEARGLDLDVEALPINVLVDKLDQADAVLLSPQVAFMQGGITEATEIPVASIDPDVYGRVDAAAIVDMAMEMVG